MGHNWQHFLLGVFYVLIGFGIALLGAFVNLIQPFIAYAIYVVAIAFTVYGGYLQIANGLISGVGYEPKKILRVSFVLIFVGFSVFSIPFILGWPLFHLETPSPFGPSYTMVIYGWLLIIFGIIGSAMIGYSHYQKRKSPPKKPHRFLKSYQPLFDEESSER